MATAKVSLVVSSLKLEISSAKTSKFVEEVISI